MAEETQYSEPEKLDALIAWNGRVMAAIDKQDEDGLLVDGHSAEGDAGLQLQREFDRVNGQLVAAQCSAAAMTKLYDEKRTQVAELEVKYEMAVYRGDNLKLRVDMVEAKFAQASGIVVAGVSNGR